MPRLKVRADGGYYVLKRYEDFNTWQILGKGVKHLLRRGVKEDGRFDTTSFMKLLSKGWVYHGARPARASGNSSQDTIDERAVKHSASNFYRLLHQGQLADAARYLASDPSSSPLELLTLQPIRSNVVTFKIDDAIVFDLPPDVAINYSNARQCAEVFVTVDRSHQRSVDLFDFWFQIDGEWRINWALSGQYPY